MLEIHSHPPGRPRVTRCIFLISDAHRRERKGGREGKRGKRKAQGRGERVGGDEWEWWVYWVLSGWVDAG